LRNLGVHLQEVARIHANVERLILLDAGQSFGCALEGLVGGLILRSAEATDGRVERSDAVPSL
jgi:hypothetical protein